MILIQRYIARHVLISTLFVFAVVLALIFILGLLKELSEIGTGDYGLGSAITYVILLIPHMLYQFFPMLVLLGSVLGLSVLAGSHELTVMRTAGVSTQRIMLSVMRVAVLLIVIMVCMGEWLSPLSSALAEKRKSIAVSRGQVIATASGTWIHENNNFLHVNVTQGKTHLEGVTRYEFDPTHRLLASYYVKSMDWKDGQWWLHGLLKTTFNKNNTTISTQQADAVSHFEFTPHALNNDRLDPDEMSIIKLNQRMHYLEGNHLQASSFQLEYWQRIFRPLAIFVMILLALPLVFVGPRSINRGAQIFWAIMISFSFFTLTSLLGSMSVVLQFSPFFAVLLPILFFSAMGYIIMLRVIR